MGWRTALGCIGLSAVLAGCASESKNLMWAGGPIPSFRAETHSYGIPREYALAMQAYGVSDPAAVRRYFDLVVSPREAARFVNTAKPNAVAIFPMADEEEVFYSQGFVDILEQLRQNYDLSTVVVSDERSIITTTRAVPNVSLLIIAGHGSKKSIALGAGDPATTAWTPTEERAYLDATDTKLYRELGDVLLPDATILLLSCSTGEGRESKRNLANHIYKVTRRRVIAADSPINTIQVSQFQPMIAQLGECTFGPIFGVRCSDATYEPKMKLPVLGLWGHEFPATLLRRGTR